MAFQILGGKVENLVNCQHLLSPGSGGIQSLAAICAKTIEKNTGPPLQKILS
jgi:hypothetical protein